MLLVQKMKVMSHLRHCQGGVRQWSAPTSCWPTTPPTPHHVTNPDAPNPLSFTLSFPWCQAGSFHRRRHRWLSFSTPACPEVDLVLLRVADCWGGAARKASAPGPTDPLPPSLPSLPGERWQLANTALYICSKHPFQVLPECKKAYFKKIGSKHKHPQPGEKNGRFFGPKLKLRLSANQNRNFIGRTWWYLIVWLCFVDLQ